MKVSWSLPNFEKEEKEAAIRVINSGWVTQGRETEKFEKELCDYIGCKYAIVVNNGTSALITSLLAQGIGKGDEVIVPSLTFIASVNSIIAVGAKPVLVDSDLNTWNTTPELVKEKITDKTKAILPVNVAGMPIGVEGFERLAKENSLILIEDSAESIGAQYKNKRIGGFNHTSIFSFHMAKPLSTVEGGCIVTNDKEIAEKCRAIRNHGMESGYDYSKPEINYDYGLFGLNFRITDIQSAIGREQLKKLDKTIEHRNKLVKRYKEALNGFFEFQLVPDYVSLHPYMFFGILVDEKKRDYLIKHLNKNGIPTRVCWLPTHSQRHHKNIFVDESYPNAEKIGSKIVTLPLGNALKIEEVDYIIDTIKEFLK